jgi:biotin carboxyl carrier protein
MSAISGKVGKWEFAFQKAPRGQNGSVEVEVKGVGLVTLRWKLDDHGLWIAYDSSKVGGPNSVMAGYDIEGQRDDEGLVQYRLLQREGVHEFAGLSFRRAGEAEASGGQAGKKKNIRIRSQMPGKIVRVQIKPGDTVQKGDLILVMEAMKMENDIRAPQAGVVSAVKVSVGQAIETGADLVMMEPI